MSREVIKGRDGFTTLGYVETMSDGKQKTLGIRPCWPDDYRFQHEYQRIIYRGPTSGYIQQRA